MVISELDTLATSLATDTARPPRHYLPEEFHVTDWAALEPFFQELQHRDITDAAALERWLLDRSELESVLSEDLAWRYIRMTCDTQDEARAEVFCAGSGAPHGALRPRPQREAAG
jgi:oligoendopeptidase F